MLNLIVGKNGVQMNDVGLITEVRDAQTCFIVAEGGLCNWL